MNEEKWKTAISKINKGEIRVRGYDIAEMMEKLTFAQAVFLILKGELPNPAESKIMEAILVSSIDHGATPPSTLATRTVISGGNPVNAAIAGGVLTIGDTHGGAIEKCAKKLQKTVKENDNLGEAAKEIVKKLVEEDKKMPGFGHRIHQVDPRTKKLFELADKLGISGKHTKLILAIQKELTKKTGKEIPINVDGAIGAVISDMGFDWRLGKGFFIISRTPGLLAHAFEELTREKPMRKLGNTDCEYDGMGEREIG
ncbi:MAG: citryl-CoA lyase [candidate division Zixibacteria bacterium]|nr:citryl-CoA lyase [candidate division Zixibacteria bacterium]